MVPTFCCKGATPDSATTAFVQPCTLAVNPATSYVDRVRLFKYDLCIVFYEMLFGSTRKIVRVSQEKFKLTCNNYVVQLLIHVSTCIVYVRKLESMDGEVSHRLSYHNFLYLILWYLQF